MSDNFETPDFGKIVKETQRDIRIFAKVFALNWFIDSFKNEGFTDQTFEKWDDRVQPDYRPGGKILTSSGFLRDSLEAVEASKDEIDYGSNAPYAELHNEGGTITIPITAKSRKFFWYMYKKTTEEKWKWMALTKKTEIKVKMPQRKFVGESELLMKELAENYFRIIENKFKKHLKNG